MIPPTPGPDPSSRMFGYATPPDGAGPLGPDQLWPQKAEVPFHQVLSALNPLQHVPVVGMAYRAVSGDEIPTAFKIAGSALFGGPLGLVGSIFGSLLMELFTLKPDLSRPAAPAGMAATGSEAGVQPVTPGTLTDTSYTSLATVQPEFLSNPWEQPVMVADPGRGNAAYKVAESEWDRSNRLEKGIV